MTWGSQYWGGFGETIAARYLYINREAPRFRAIANALDLRYDTAIQVLQTLEAAFDLDTAEGEQLDVLGASLGLARLGLEDERYRRALKVQRTILNATGTRPDIIQVWTDWTGSAPSTYRTVATPEHPGPEIEISGAVADGDDYLLGIFLRRVAPAGTIINAYDVDDTGDVGVDAHLLVNYTAEEPIRFPIFEDIAGYRFFPDLQSLEDLETGVIGAPDGSTYNSDERARDFDGLTNRIDYAGMPNLVGLSFALSFWIYRRSQATDDRVWNLANGDDMFVDLRTNGSVRIFWDAATTPLTRQSAASVISLNRWHHVVVTGTGLLTASDYDIYVDGQEVSSYATTTNAVGALDTTAGRWTLGGRFANDNNNVDGLIADLRVLDFIPTAAQVRSIYAASTGQLDYQPADEVPEAAPIAPSIEVPTL